MPLSDPRIIFGVHSVTPYNRTTGAFYGILKVLGGSSLSLSGELVKLNGGSLKYPWAIEEGNTTAEMSLKPKEYPDFLFELFLGKAPTAVGADTAGTVSVADNVTGTSMIAAIGVLTPIVIPSTGAANLKFGKYYIKAVSATAFDVYLSTDVDMLRGTDESYDNDALRVAQVTGVATGANSDVASLGLRFVGGASATAFVIGDTATFEVQPPSSKSMSVTVGGTADTFPEFGALLVAKQRSNGELFEVDCFRCKASGLPLGFEAQVFSEGEIKAEAFYDSAKNGVFKARHFTP